MAKALQTRGHEVVIIASSFYHKTRQETRQYDGAYTLVENVDGVTFCGVKTPPYRGNSLARLENMVSFTRHVWFGRELQSLEAPDIILGSSPPLFGAYGAMKRARRMRVPFVLEVRDLWPDSLIDLGLAGKANPLVKLMRIVEKRLYRSARKIVTLLPSSQPYFADHGVAAEKVVWVPNAYSAISSAPAESPPLHDDSCFTLMYAGVHGHYSHLELLLDAMAILQQQKEAANIRLRMIGDGPVKAELMRQAKDTGLRNVLFEPAVPKQKLGGILRSADAFVLVKKPARIYRWGFSPNKLFDYMAHGKPVVFAGTMAHDYVKIADAGVSTDPSPRSLANGILELAKMTPEARQRFGSNAREYVLKNHDMGVLVERLLPHLKQVVTG
jgi:glycosyltransferase involved in cell wall biosynthesis